MWYNSCLISKGPTESHIWKLKYQKARFEKAKTQWFPSEAQGETLGAPNSLAIKDTYSSCLGFLEHARMACYGCRLVNAPSCPECIPVLTYKAISAPSASLYLCTEIGSSWILLDNLKSTVLICRIWDGHAHLITKMTIYIAHLYVFWKERGSGSCTRRPRSAYRVTQMVSFEAIKQDLQGL